MLSYRPNFKNSSLRKVKISKSSRAKTSDGLVRKKNPKNFRPGIGKFLDMCSMPKISQIVNQRKAVTRASAYRARARAFRARAVARVLGIRGGICIGRYIYIWQARDNKPQLPRVRGFATPRPHPPPSCVGQQIQEAPEQQQDVREHLITRVET